MGDAMKQIFTLFLVCFTTYFSFSQIDHRFAANYNRDYKVYCNYLYMAYSNGLSVCNLTTGVRDFYTSLNSILPGNFVNSLLPLKEGGILASTNYGLMMIDSGETFSIDKPICRDFPGTDARYLYYDSLGSIWTFSSHQVYRFKAGQWTTFDLSQKVQYSFDLANLIFFRDEVLAEYQDNTLSETVFYYATVQDDYYRFAIINDTGIVKLLERRPEFPFRQGNLNFVTFDNTLWMQNYDTLYSYDGTDWNVLYIFNLPYYSLSIYNPMHIDRDSNIWVIGYNKITQKYLPLSYNLQTGETTENIIKGGQKSISSLDIMGDGTVVASDGQSLFFKNDTSWVEKSNTDLGIPDGIGFSIPKILADGNLWTFIASKNSTEYPQGTIMKLGSVQFILKPFYQGLNYKTITNLGVGGNKKGIFKGRFGNEPVQYEADSGLVQPNFNSSGLGLDFKPASDGHVYFQYNTTLLTWKGNQLINLAILDTSINNGLLSNFEPFGNYIYIVGGYPGDVDSSNPGEIITTYNSFLFQYDLTTKKSEYWDAITTGLPHFKNIFYPSMGFSYYSDTIPNELTISNNGTVWIKTWYSIVSFTPTECHTFTVPMSSGFSELSHIYYSENEGILANNKLYIFLFNTSTETWDSLTISDAGIKGSLIKIEKALDGRIWACDDKGYFYSYIGNGHFSTIDLQLKNGKTYLGFPINDFCIDNNNLLYLGTDIGLLVFDILTGVDETKNFNTGLILYPNPSSDYINISFLNNENSDFQDVHIYDIFGQEIDTKLIPYSIETGKIDISNLSTGVYFVRLGTKVAKFIKI